MAAMRHCLITLSSLYAGITIDTRGCCGASKEASSEDLSGDIPSNLAPIDFVTPGLAAGSGKRSILKEPGTRPDSRSAWTKYRDKKCRDKKEGPLAGPLHRRTGRCGPVFTSRTAFRHPGRCWRPCS